MSVIFVWLLLSIVNLYYSFLEILLWTRCDNIWLNLLKNRVCKVEVSIWKLTSSVWAWISFGTSSLTKPMSTQSLCNKHVVYGRAAVKMKHYELKSVSDFPEIRRTKYWCWYWHYFKLQNHDNQRRIQNLELIGSQYAQLVQAEQNNLFRATNANSFLANDIC